jgi:hypothetical protein
MGGWTIPIVLFVVIVAAVVGLVAYRRGSTPKASRSRNAPSGKKKEPGKKEAGKKEVGKKPEQWGVQVSALAPERACPQAQALMDKAFSIETKPRLPLPDCPFPQKCECRFTKLFERRSDERRSGKERREKGARFEKEPPRRLADRRKNIRWD